MPHLFYYNWQISQASAFGYWKIFHKLKYWLNKSKVILHHPNRPAKGAFITPQFGIDWSDWSQAFRGNSTLVPANRRSSAGKAKSLKIALPFNNY